MLTAASNQWSLPLPPPTNSLARWDKSAIVSPAGTGLNMWFISSMSSMRTIGLSAGRNKHGKLVTAAAAKAAPQQEHHYPTGIPLGQIPGSQSWFRVQDQTRSINLGAVKCNKNNYSLLSTFVDGVIIIKAQSWRMILFFAQPVIGFLDIIRWSNKAQSPILVSSPPHFTPGTSNICKYL